MTTQEPVLILTPVKNAEPHLRTFFRLLEHLTYPRHLLSIGMLESDSDDRTWERLEDARAGLEQRYRAVTLCQKEFGYRIPPGTPRWSRSIQLERRSVLAKSRNHLLFRALRDETWVLWLDVDVIDYPADIIERLTGTGKDIVQPNCVKHPGGKSFDLNAWRDKGRLHLHDLRAEGDLVPLHAVGGTMLLVHADIHREGLVFPTYLHGNRSPLIRDSHPMFGLTDIGRRLRDAHRGEIETEGLGIMAHDMGYECWGMPNLEIVHIDQ